MEVERFECVFVSFVREQTLKEFMTHKRAL